jgi:hypothetical protein
VKLYLTGERPSTLPAVCAPSFGLPVPFAAEVAHAARVGVSPVEHGVGVRPVQRQMQAGSAQIQGINGFLATDTAKDDPTAPKQRGGASGVPPRGRPV